jgi:hypothetical protein
MHIQSRSVNRSVKSDFIPVARVVSQPYDTDNIAASPLYGRRGPANH